MKQFIVVMTFLMLGLFISGLINEFKSPLDAMQNNSINEINSVASQSAIGL